MNLKLKGVKYNTMLAVDLFPGHNKHVEITRMLRLSPPLPCLLGYILYYSSFFFLRG